MNAIYLLIPLTLLILFGAIALFFWAVNNDQYDDLDKEAHRILFDEEKSTHKDRQTQSLQKNEAKEEQS